MVCFSWVNTSSVSWRLTRGIDFKHIFNRNIVAVISLILLPGTIAYNAGWLVVNALEGENNLDLLVPYIHPCEEQNYYASESQKNIVLRLDDVQSYAWTDVSRQIIDDARANNFPVVLGVIPHNIREDGAMYDYLREVRCDVEFAIHGWDNRFDEEGNAEFQILSERDAAARLNKAKMPSSAYRKKMSLALFHQTTFTQPVREKPLLG